ncbi:hypothetical protein Mesci_0831 [Mesorhizobium ciceri biovar biserrulae WSM1271]|uniref:Uncharacterized protein n=1 Tax=Mesorhizobium ciceri biovar biserrulae (strain HAMBI 2942 / LMG 23838 / WSM1271) TaxID=765698 RepID=E8TGR2_MESCW|nr:hypothetical protein Mesci_0831 [Mesorhizobium ciceri biovar biserrulae WSM1271]
MPTFGISAFLRLIHMNVRPQRTELRRRSMPREGGYDFHSSLRRLCHRLMAGESLESLLAATLAIAQGPERQSAQLGLRRLDAWRALNPGAILEFPATTVRSLGETFSVTFTPNFGLRVGSQTVAIHVWNTAAPRLEPRLVRAVLSAFQAVYQTANNSPDDIAVLCLQTMRFIRLGDASDVAELGRLIFTNIDGIFREIAADLGETPSAPGDHPAPPPGE